MAEEVGSGSSGEHLARCADDLYFSALHAAEDLLPSSGGEQAPLTEARWEETSPIVTEEELLLPASGEKQALPASGEESPLVLDENYARLLQFQEVLVSSVTGATAAAAAAASGSPDQVGSCHRYTAASALPETTVIAGEPSCKRTLCDICAEVKPVPEMFQNPSCSHVFCKECVGRHISTHVQANVTAVKCLALACGVELEPEQCREVVPAEVFDRWGAALCEVVLLGYRRFYCPFRDCSAPLLDDGEEAVQASECPHCHRLFCAQCGVPWHAGVECEEFQNLRADERGGHDLMLLDLVKCKSWKRCPSCRFYVEKGEGCLHITCRCGFQFCYGCGSTWSDVHTSCHT